MNVPPDGAALEDRADEGARAGIVTARLLKRQPSATATVDAELKLGSVEETVTVSGQASVVDVQSASLQRVISKEIIDAIPAGRGQSALAVLIPGMIPLVRTSAARTTSRSAPLRSTAAAAPTSARAWTG